MKCATEHKKCAGTEDCVIVPNLSARDLRYHNVPGTEHCARCGVMWTKRPSQCKPRQKRRRSAAKD